MKKLLLIAGIIANITVTASVKEIFHELLGSVDTTTARVDCSRINSLSDEQLEEVKNKAVLKIWHESTRGPREERTRLKNITKLAHLHSNIVLCQYRKKNA